MSNEYLFVEHDSGLVKGTLDATGGDQQEEFSISKLTTCFSATMFESDFAGGIDGRIEGEAVGVPELALPALEIQDLDGDAGINLTSFGFDIEATAFSVVTFGDPIDIPDTAFSLTSTGFFD